MLRSTESSFSKAIQLFSFASRLSITRTIAVSSTTTCRNKTTLATRRSHHKEPTTQTAEDNQYKRKRRFVNVDSTLSEQNKYLYTMPKDPYFSASKVKKILELGKVEDAIEFISALPLRLQATATWNEVIGHCAREGRANFAENCYTKMRKRGFKPNEYTITHMLLAYANSTSPSAVEKAEEWFKKMHTFDISPSTIHFTNMMRVYNEHKLPEKAIQLLHDMSETDTAPDTFTYAVALRSCSQLTDPRQQAHEVKHIWQEVLKRTGQPKIKPAHSLLGKKASKIRWELPTSQTKRLELDDTLVIALITGAKIVAKNTDNMSLGIEMIDTLFSMTPSSQIVSESDNVADGVLAARNQSILVQYPLNVKTFDAVLRFAKDLKQWRVLKDYFNAARKLYPNVTPDEPIMEMVAACENILNSKRRK